VPPFSTAVNSFRPHNPLVVCSNHTGPSFGSRSISPGRPGRRFRHLAAADAMLPGRAASCGGEQPL
jgi:hypothetical protein